jgi:hypothetical protein
MTVIKSELARLEALVPKWEGTQTEVEMLTHAAVSECRLLREALVAVVDGERDRARCDCGMTTEMGLSWLKMIDRRNHPPSCAWNRTTHPLLRDDRKLGEPT